MEGEEVSNLVSYAQSTSVVISGRIWKERKKRSDGILNSLVSAAERSSREGVEIFNSSARISNLHH